MVRFFKRFEIVTVWDYMDDEHTQETKAERQRQFEDIAKHFGFGWTKAALSFEVYPPDMRKRDNIVLFTRGKAVKVSWKCIISPKMIDRFMNEVSDYTEDNDYADYAVYGLP